MKLAFIDCSIAGVAGDMLTAALIDAGASAERVKQAMISAGSCFGEVKVKIKHVEVNGIRAARVDVATEDQGGRSYREIVNGLKKIDLPEVVRDKALAALRKLAEAESRVHGRTLDKLHLHEVGAADAVADIVGACTAAEDLGLFEGEIVSSEIAVGKGLTNFTHGSLPIPPPAVLEILKGKPLVGVATPNELTTPTGAALVTTLASRYVGTFPSMRVLSVGYGAGSRDFPSPNFTRVCVGETWEASESGEIAVLETNVDSVTGEVIGYAIEKLLAAGALDAGAIPMIMKKGRPGFLLRVLARPKEAERLSRVLMQETGTLGVRLMPSVHRYMLEREIVRVDLKLAGLRFKPRVKVAREGGRIVGWRAEYEDAKAIADRTGISLREVIRKVEEAARSKVR
ncbi:MAG: nickel pincer cofactor biosynthesis protein LarC [Candidatus Hadarchaeum sp.]|uniref:nickel pincer cofactor biosynthesis protein LarC n=1 Tax=Candidatus Hadarchaeum sp. TaxID=2883567 RepID=UPI003D09ED3C